MNIRQKKYITLLPATLLIASLVAREGWLFFIAVGSCAFLPVQYTVLILAAAIPFNGLARMVLGAGVGIWKECLVTLLFTVTVIGIFIRRRTLMLKDYELLVGLEIVIFWTLALAALLWSNNYDFTTSAAVCATYVIYTLLVPVLWLLGPLLDRAKVHHTLITSGTVVAFLAIIEARMGVKFSDTAYTYLAHTSIIRPMSVTGSALGLGYYLATVGVLCLHYIVKSMTMWRVLCFVTIVCGLFESTCRGGMVVFAIGVLAVLLRAVAKRPVKNFVTFVVVLSLTIIGISLMITRYASTEWVGKTQRLIWTFSVQDEGNSQRIQRWITSLEEWAEAPVLGHGYGVGGNIPQLYSKTQVDSTDLFISESWPLRLLLELGMVGLLTWYAIPLTILILAKRRRSSSIEGLLVLILLVAGFGLQVFEFYLINFLFWLFCGQMMASLLESTYESTRGAD